jgi:hypothetical protein
MIKRLTRIAPLKLGLVTAGSAALLGLLSLPVGFLMDAIFSSSDSDYSYNQIPLHTSSAAPGSSPTGNPGVHAIQLSNGVVPDSPTVTNSSTTATPSGGANGPAGSPTSFDYHVTGNAYAPPFYYMLGLPLVMGFLFGWIGALIFNLLAKWTGGIEVTVEDIT